MVNANGSVKMVRVSSILLLAAVIIQPGQVAAVSRIDAVRYRRYSPLLVPACMRVYGHFESRISNKCIL